jgi:cell division protein FtsL
MWDISDKIPRRVSIATSVSPVSNLTGKEEGKNMIVRILFLGLVVLSAIGVIFAWQQTRQKQTTNK